MLKQGTAPEPPPVPQQDLKHILLIKTSSLGDVIHTLPAIEEACQYNPSLRFHWVVEAPFADITRWHPNVVRAIPVRLRQWRKTFWHPTTWNDWRAFKSVLALHAFDKIIDAQGLIKSAYLTRLAHGPRHGFAKTVAREPLAARFYDVKHAPNPNQHAVARTRALFAEALGYTAAATPADYGLRAADFACPDYQGKRYIVLLHGTTWESKHWPDAHWCALAKRAIEANVQVHVLWGNAREYQRALTIAKVADNIVVHPKRSLNEIAGLLAHAQAAVGVDTGLGHMAAALGTPMISLYGPTSPARTGTVGARQYHKAASTATYPCVPCFKRNCDYVAPSDATGACLAGITPEAVWHEVALLANPEQ